MPQDRPAYILGSIHSLAKGLSGNGCALAIALAHSTKEKAAHCRALHAGAEPTLSAACWDVGAACLFARVGVPLIDTTSFGAMARVWPAG